MGWRGLAGAVAAMVLCGSAAAQRMMNDRMPKEVATSPAKDALPTIFHDDKFGVRFEVPAGWTFLRQDGQVSTFRLDAKTASPRAEMRGVASLEYNPYPQSVLSGATFYYSVERHARKNECALQVGAKDAVTDVQNIGGMEFRHGHAEYGGICVEGRDEVYTAYRRGSCYRFDMAVNTFCSISSGADDLTERQFLAVEQHMTDILSSVVLDWKKGGARAVPLPPIVHTPRKKAEPELLPRVQPPAHVGQ